MTEPTPSLELQALREQLRLLSLENDRLTERAEETLLLGLIAEQVNAQDTHEALLAAGLEQISLLKDLPLCAYGQRLGAELHILHAHFSLTHASLRDLRLPLPLAPLDPEPMLLDAEAVAQSGLVIETPGQRFVPASALFLPFPCRSQPLGVFLFASPCAASRLDTMQPLLRRVVEMISARLDTLDLLRELTVLNRELDQRVESRTRELKLAHDALAKEAIERAQAMETLSFTQFTVDHMADAVFWIRADGSFLYVNDTACQALGYSRLELLRMRVEEVNPDYAPGLWGGHWQQLKEGKKLIFETRHRKRDGAIFPVEVRSGLLEYQGQEYNCAIARDISERKRAAAERDQLREQFNQAQKMESVGRLAGGVAHDFNNLLSVILGYAELSLMGVDPHGKLHANLQEIQGAALRSAALTRQLLAFARKQNVTPQVMDINTTVEGMLKMMQRLIGEDIDLRWHPAADLWPVKIDPAQIDQILVNLCVNARDAISGVGKLTIASENSVVDQAYCAKHAGCTPGEYIRLTVSDNGCGMPPQVIAHIFEPFFTTKELGQGTGLGLATIYGIVSQNNGFIAVESEPDQGTTFKIYLPRHAEEVVPVHHPGPETRKRHGHETILLVEDDLAMLNINQMMLAQLGYRALPAASPDEAIRLAAEHAGHIQLLLTDVVMPTMNGRDLSKRLLALYPPMKCLFMSGYTANVIAHYGVLEQGMQFIQKPFSLQALDDKIHETLAQG